MYYKNNRFNELCVLKAHAEYNPQTKESEVFIFRTKGVCK